MTEASRLGGPRSGDASVFERLDLRVARQFDVSRRKAQDVIGAGQVDVGTTRVRDAGYRVDPSALIRFDPNRRREEAIRLSVPVNYQDDTLAVVDKPAGLLTVPTDGASHEDSVLNRVRNDLRGVRGPRAYVGALHRLDRGTSGLVAMALSRDCHAAGREAFRDHAFFRQYLALVEGAPRSDADVIDLPIADEYEGGMRHIATDADEPSRRAVTRFRVKERLFKAALLEVELETGRQHQIRLHLRAIGHPIIGDGVYGASPLGHEGRPMLHAARLSFPHPLTAAPIDCLSEPPADFVAALMRLRGRRR